MSADTLEQVKSLIDKLTLPEREELLEYLKPHTQTHGNGDSEKSKRGTLEEAWRLSDEMTATEDPNSETMTQEFLRTRR